MGGSIITRVSTLGIALALAAAASAGLGCKPSSGTGPGPGDDGAGGGEEVLTAEEFYVKHVHPEIDATCGGCHTSDAGCYPQFMEASPNPSYDVIKSYRGLVTHPDNSNLIYHGAHTGPALTESQEALIADWLDLEMEGKEAPPINMKDAIAEFGQCMQYTDFQDNNVYLLAYQQTAGVGPCGSCHKSGEAGTWIGYNEEEMWDQNTKLPFIKRIVQPVFDDDNNLVDLQPSNRFADKVGGVCGGEHPTALISAVNIAALDTYFSITKTRWEQGICQ